MEGTSRVLAVILLMGLASASARPAEPFIYSGPLFLAFATGFVLPTATGDSFGLGKWIVSPAFAPVYFFPGRGISPEAEVPFGEHRQGDWILKSVFYRRRD